MTGVIVSVVVAVIVLFVMFLMYFYRDPCRKIPQDDVLVSPADGRVIAIVDVDRKLDMKKGFGRVKVFTKDMGAGQFTAVSIFMNVLDVHVNRTPIDGEIGYVRHKKGKFVNAAKPKAFENEKVEVMLFTKIGRVKVIQIAGLLARRIESFIKKGDKISRGMRIGRIKLGSQVTLIFPRNKVKVRVEVGDRLLAGSSVIGEIK